MYLENFIASKNNFRLSSLAPLALKLPHEVLSAF